MISAAQQKWASLHRVRLRPSKALGKHASNARFATDTDFSAFSRKKLLVLDETLKISTNRYLIVFFIMPI